MGRKTKLLLLYCNYTLLLMYVWAVCYILPNVNINQAKCSTLYLQGLRTPLPMNGRYKRLKSQRYASHCIPSGFFACVPTPLIL